jgi:uncharacterized membrane protein HdeD (DUF308 family)
MGNSFRTITYLLEDSEIIMTDTAIHPTRSLRNLYLVRTVFQVLWAGAMFAFARTQPELGAILFTLYPLWDVACTVYDLRTSSQTGDTRRTQRINALLGVTAAIGIGLTVFQQPMYAVAVFGAWALGAGALQLIAGLIRRKQELGGQWAMILSGAQSSAAGIAFVVGGLLDKRHVQDVAGYATFGAVYFLISGILLTRKLSRLSEA